MSEAQAVLVDTSDGIMTITLNRPQVKNAINNAMAGGLMRLPRQIPSRLAMEMALTGEFIDADRAPDWKGK